MAAFEGRLADATQDALDRVIQAAVSTSKSDLEQFRIKEFLLAHQLIHESHRWLNLASNPLPHQVSLTQICRLTELAFKLKCLATGMPFGDEPRRRPRPEDRPGYWTAPTVEEALQKIYGSDSDEASAPPVAGEACVSAGRHSTADGSISPASPPASAPSSAVPLNLPIIPVPPPAAPSPPVPRRSDVWSRWAGYQRRR